MSIDAPDRDCITMPDGSCVAENCSLHDAPPTDHDYRVDPVLCVDDWETNADLMLDVAKLGYLSDDKLILDCTYGAGGWWKKWTPRHFFTSDVDVSGGAEYEVDFTEMPDAWEAKFDAVCFDPPYVSTGGRKTSTIDEFNDRYKIGGDSPGTPAKLQSLIDLGLRECARVTKKRGLILVKCMNYVSSGHLFPGVFLTWDRSRELNLRLQDWFVHQREPGMQPAREREDGVPVVQQHARSNYSCLLVFKK